MFIALTCSVALLNSFAFSAPSKIVPIKKFDYAELKAPKPTFKSDDKMGIELNRVARQAFGGFVNGVPSKLMPLNLRRIFTTILS